MPRFEPTGDLGPEQYWVTGAVADLDRDGRQDLVAVEWEPSLPTLFFRNTGTTGHWLGLDVPVGSTVDVVPAGGGAADGDRLARLASGNSAGYAAGPSTRVWTGLGATRRVRVTITPPGGRALAMGVVPADRC